MVTAAQMNAQIRDNENFLYTERAGMFRGLHLRTHLDSDVAANKVSLLGLDDIVMDTGARYSGLTLPLVADITASGAAGLDTGSRVASNWYETYLIGKSSSNAVADLRLLLHRAKGYSLNQLQTASDATQILRSGATTNIKLGQSFQTANTGLIEFIDLSLVKTGAPTGNIWVTLETDSGGGLPSGTALATSQKINVANIATTATVLRFVFNTPASFTAATKYFIVLQADYAVSATVQVAWSSKSADPYPTGDMFKFDGTSWVLSAGPDFYFRIYVTVNSTAVSMPSGWDQKLKIGYVYNTAGNALQPFIQRERRVVQLAALASGSFGVTVPTLIDCSAFVPPCPVVIQIAAANDTNATFTIVGGVPDGFFLNTYRGGGGSIFVVGNTAAGVGAATYLGDIPTQAQAVYAWVTAANGQVWVSSYDWLN